MDKIVLVWCAQSGKNLGALKGHTQPVTCLCWQPLHVAEGDSFPLLATSSKDAAVRIWAALMQSAIIKLCAWNCQTCKLFWCVCISHRTLLWEMVSYQLVSPTFGFPRTHLSAHAYAASPLTRSQWCKYVGPVNDPTSEVWFTALAGTAWLRYGTQRMEPCWFLDLKVGEVGSLSVSYSAIEGWEEMCLCSS